ncbi:MAG: restriction endonuclease subunit S [Clostridium beijerinckii]
MEKNKENVPKIRFPGFTGEWEQRKLGEITDRIVRKNTDNESTLPLTISAQYGLVDQISFFNKRIASRDVSNYYLIKKGEFAYNKSYSDGYPYGAIKRLERYDMGVLSTLYIVFRIKEYIINSDYLVSYYDSNNWHNEVANRAAEGARNHGLLNISADDFFSTELKFPKELEEQRKIGEYFIKIENLITLHQRKLEHLQDKKKGLLQKMFPKEGEKFPELRFPGFTEHWERRKLNDVAIFIDGNYGEKYPKDDEFIENGVPFFTSAVIGTAGVFDKKNVKYISKEKNSILVKGQSLGGDIILTNRGASMGVVAQIPLEYGLVNIGPQLTRIRGIEKADNLFLLSMFNNSSYNRKLLSINSGSAMNFIGLEALGKFEFMCPKLDEQAQIGAFFKNIDNLITLHQRKLEHLQQQKKGLLQQMFIR